MCICWTLYFVVSEYISVARDMLYIILIRIDWLIDYLEFYVPLKNISLLLYICSIILDFCIPDMSTGTRPLLQPLYQHPLFYPLF
jgi:hypothetical protein